MNLESAESFLVIFNRLPAKYFLLPTEKGVSCHRKARVCVCCKNLKRKCVCFYEKHRLMSIKGSTRAGGALPSTAECVGAVHMQSVND